jgi:hypothetical protein
MGGTPMEKEALAAGVAADVRRLRNSESESESER